MTTSHQALRLGLRLGLTRLMGFYYAHIGYYIGQVLWLHLSRGYTYHGYTYHGYTYNGYTYHGYAYNGYTHHGYTHHGYT